VRFRESEIPVLASSSRVSVSVAVGNFVNGGKT
jgi:hypothetical protein